MAKKRKLKLYTGTASDGVTVLISASGRKEAQKLSHTDVLRIKITKPGLASTVSSVLDNLCEPKQKKKASHDRTVNLG